MMKVIWRARRIYRGIFKLITVYTVHVKINNRVILVFILNSLVKHCVFQNKVGFSACKRGESLIAVDLLCSAGLGVEQKKEAINATHTSACSCILISSASGWFTRAFILTGRSGPCWRATLVSPSLVAENIPLLPSIGMLWP